MSGLYGGLSPRQCLPCQGPPYKVPGFFFGTPSALFALAEDRHRGCRQENREQSCPATDKGQLIGFRLANQEGCVKGLTPETVGYVWPSDIGSICYGDFVGLGTISSCGAVGYQPKPLSKIQFYPDNQHLMTLVSIAPLPLEG